MPSINTNLINKKAWLPLSGVPADPHVHVKKANINTNFDNKQLL